MPAYEHKCKVCGSRFLTQTRTEKSCPLGHNDLARVFSFNTTVLFEPHFNASVGKYVRNQAEFNSELSRLSDDMSERVGMTHNFVPVDQQDRQAFGVTDEGQENFDRVHYDKDKGTFYA